jgi:DNA-binding NtrC family response regulator
MSSPWKPGNTCLHPSRSLRRATSAISVGIVADHPDVCERVAALLPRLRCRLHFATLDQSTRDLTVHPPDLAMIASPVREATRELACLRQLRAACPGTRFVFLAGGNSEAIAVEAFHSGAHRYITHPWTPAALQQSIATLLQSLGPPADPGGLIGGDRLVGDTPVMHELRRVVGRVAAANSTVLIRGETGTGKELVAQLIHENSTRAAGPFVCINSAAIPDSLLENELFGHERGAFTGATGTDPGKLLAAQSGTAFLDEIGDLGTLLQAKLLRAIENKSFARLGGSRPVDIDVRFVAATNCDLERSMHDGRFRSDLYYRLNVLRVNLPNLRDRADDIPLLVAHYLARFNRELGRNVAGLSRRSLNVLREYDWPGNVRELRNVLEALMVNLSPETEGIVDAPSESLRQLMAANAAPVSDRERLLRALAEASWNKTRAASRLHISRMTLYRRMLRYDVSRRRTS